jgi:hypothetical protein
MRKYLPMFIVLVGVVGLSFAAQSFTTLNVSQYWGKTGIPALTSALDANFGALTTTDDVQFANISATQSTSGTVATVTITGAENADAKLILDADDGDDGADKWTLESEASGNDLSILNDTTEVVNVTSAGAVSLASVDSLSAATLSLGEATATKVEIADASVETEVQGTLDVHEEANFVRSVAVGTTLGITKTTIAMTEGLIITNLSGYVSLTTTGAVTGSVSTAIADGATGNNFLIIENGGAHDVIIKDGANTKFSGDLTLTGGANDTLTVLWNGTDWIGLGLTDN